MMNKLSGIMDNKEADQDKRVHEDQKLNDYETHGNDHMKPKK